MKGFVERVLRRGPATVETIAAELQVTIPEALQALTMLELEGRVEEVGGRYRLATPAKSDLASSKSKPGDSAKNRKNSEPAVQQREVCRVVYFDARGRFTTNPRAATRARLRPVKPRPQDFSEEIDLDGQPGGPTAVITRRGGRYEVRLKDPSLEAERRQARAVGDGVTLAAIDKYERDLKQIALDDYLERLEARDATEALEKSFRGDQARKAARTRKARQNALTDEQRKQAANQAAALELRIKNARGELDATRSQRQKVALRGRIRRWSRALDQLNKISQGRAYKWPGASLLR